MLAWIDVKGVVVDKFFELSSTSTSDPEPWDVGFEEVHELALLASGEEDESYDVECILLLLVVIISRSAEDDGEGHKGDGIFVSLELSNSDGAMAGDNSGLDECMEWDLWSWKASQTLQCWVDG